MLNKVFKNGVAMCLGLVLAFSHSVYGEEGGEDNSNMESTNSASSAGSAGESAAARTTKMGGVELGLGMIAGAVPGSQLHGYYNINPDLSVGFIAMSGTLDMSDAIDDEPTTRLTKAEVGYSAFGAAARWFMGNSFY